MNTSELKLELIQTIAATQSDSLLAEIRKLVRMDSEDEAIYELNEEQISQIQIAEQQIVEGKYLTHEAAQKQTKEWLKDSDNELLDIIFESKEQIKNGNSYTMEEMKQRIESWKKK